MSFGDISDVTLGNIYCNGKKHKTKNIYFKNPLYAFLLNFPYNKIN